MQYKTASGATVEHAYESGTSRIVGRDAGGHWIAEHKTVCGKTVQQRGWSHSTTPPSPDSNSPSWKDTIDHMVRVWGSEKYICKNCLNKVPAPSHLMMGA